MIRRSLFLVVSVIFLHGCGSHGSNVFGMQGKVAVVDSKSRAHLQAGLTGGDYLALAEQVTNEMLASRLVQGWKDWKPRVILGDLYNNTDNENIRVRDLHNRIQEVLFRSETIRVVDRSATSFDFIIRSELSSTRQYGSSGEQLAHFTLQLKLLKLNGELVGQWSEDLALAKAGRSLF